MLTEEQQLIVDTVCSASDNEIIAVNAIAGSGKTATGNAIIRAIKPKNGFYTAFNKAIITDSAKKFGDLLDCRTIHSFAYKYVRPKRNIEEFNFSKVEPTLLYDDRVLIAETLDDFYRSDNLNLYEYLENLTIPDILKDFVALYAEQMSEGKINPTFNFMLKMLHLNLANGNISITKDLLILDECQDTTGVALEIFKLIDCPKKVILGDKFQNIYSFMKTVNAFDLLPNLIELKLTKSFRCIDHIANQIEKYGKKYLSGDFEYKGSNSIDINGLTAYISRSNNVLIDKLLDLYEQNVNFSLTRPIREICALPLAIDSVKKGIAVSKKYKYLQDDYKTYKASKNTPATFTGYLLDKYESDTSLEPAIKTTNKIIKQFDNVNSFISSIEKRNKGNKIVVTTAHAFKGLEADTVIIQDDLNMFLDKARIELLKADTSFYNIDFSRKHLPKELQEELNTYYVALSRAKTQIFNAQY